VNRLLPLLALVVGSQLLGCSETLTSPEGPPDTSSWLAEAIITPSAFEALTAANRDGWVALHASDLNTAVRAFERDSTGQYRARLARQAVYTDLAAMTDLAVWRTLQVWQRRGLPTNDGILGVVPLWRRCGGPQRLPTALTDGATIPFDGTTVPEWANDRIDAYGGDVEALRELVAVPVLQTETRIIRDPCGYAFLLASDDPAALIQTLSEAQGLASRFLSAMPTADDLTRESVGITLPGVLGATSPSLPPFSAMDLTSMHASVEALDTAIDAERLRIVQQAPLDGVSLLSELALAERLRQEVLVARSRTLMEAYPALAGALADIAWDATDRAIGPKNTAGAASARARALLQQGRTREALDALEPLLTAMPESAGAREWVADLAVLESLDHVGDSKEE
jgi:hypothetical protein